MSMDYCYHCMESMASSAASCGACGKPPPKEYPPYHLPPGTLLNKKYLLGCAIGEGGFGITYIGRDMTLDMKVAVKEYFPSGFVNRNGTASPLVTSSVSHGNRDYFQTGRDRFLAEARILAKFAGEPGVVCVRDYFEENNTAYIVMEYLDGETLREYIKRQGRLSPEDTVRLLVPVMESLEKIHQQGLIHRDISPDNIMLRDGQSKLLDFGAARSTAGNVGKSLSVLLKPGYAPEEQYRSKGRQGPWTDVYALCATMYKCITGVTPDESIQRSFQDELKTPTEMGITIRPDWEAAIMKGLSIHQTDRFQSMQEILDSLRATPKTDVTAERQDTAGNSAAVEEDQPTELLQNQEPFSSEKREEEEAAEPALVAVEERSLVRQEEPRHSEASGLSTKKKVLIIAATLVLAVLILLVRHNAGKVTLFGEQVKSDTTMAYISQETITTADVRDLSKLKQLETLSFNECTFISDALPLLSKLSPSLRSLRFSSCIGLTSLDSLSSFSNLTSLTIEESALDNAALKGLQNVSGLEWVYLSGNPALTDLSPLTASAETLTDLVVDRTGVTDFSCLAGCANLRSLSACENGIKELSSLTVPSLVRLSLDQNQLTDLADIDRFQLLQTLSARDNQIMDLTPLAGLTALSELTVDNNRITDIQPLSTAKSLTTFEANNNAIGTLAPLSGCRQLRCLSANHNKLTDLEGLDMALELRELHAVDNQITNLNGLANCTVLQTVELSKNLITDISLLQKSAETLQQVFLSDNLISDIGALQHTAALETLCLDNNAITDLTALSNSVSLRTLSANNNQITSLGGLESATVLRYLYLANNQLESTATLKSLSEQASEDYVVIDLSGNALVSLSGNLPASKKINNLAVYGNPLTSLRGLEDANGSCLMFSYVEGMDVTQFKDNFSKFYIVDCPPDHQLSVKKDLVGEFGIGAYICTTDEAENAIRETRSSVLKDVE